MPGVADQAADFLRGLAGGNVNLAAAEETATPATSAQDVQMQYKVALAQQRASRAKWDKWMKRVGMLLVGAAAAYWFFKREEKKR